MRSHFLASPLGQPGRGSRSCPPPWRNSEHVVTQQSLQEGGKREVASTRANKAISLSPSATASTDRTACGSRGTTQHSSMKKQHEPKKHVARGAAPQIGVVSLLTLNRPGSGDTGNVAPRYEESLRCRSASAAPPLISAREVRAVLVPLSLKFGGSFPVSKACMHKHCAVCPSCFLVSAPWRLCSPLSSIVGELGYRHSFRTAAAGEVTGWRLRDSGSTAE